MKKVFAISGLMLLVLLASCSKAQEAEITSAITNETPNEVAATTEVENTVELAANYKDYDASLIGQSENTVIFFHAGWCPSCVSADKNISWEEIPAGTTILKADFDGSTELKQKYGVTSQHTFVQIDSEWNLVKKWSGSNNVADILENVEVAMMKKDGDAMMEKEDAMMKKDGDAMMEKEDAMMKKDGDAMMEKEGTYASYDAALVGQNKNTVLFFHAAWCPSCVAADKAISAEEVPAGLTILKTDFDNSTDLRKKYGVVSQHTFVLVDADGNQIKKWTGGTSSADIVEKL